MFDIAKSIAEAQEELNALARNVRGEAQCEDAHVVERHPFKGGVNLPP